MSDGFTKERKYLVWKIHDIQHLLSEKDQETIAKIAGKIAHRRAHSGKPPEPSYVVVNEKEDYAKDVWELIALHASHKGK